MNEIDVLILEDSDKDFASIHKENFDFFNINNQLINFSYENNRAKNIDEAQKLLNSNKNYHAAIIDLKLAHGVADDGQGNILIQNIYKNYRIPIFVYSNNLPLLDESDYEKGIFFRSYSKATKPFIEILNEIEELIQTGFIEILGKRGLIDKALNEIFWNHFSKNLDFWKSLENPKEEKEKILVRYISEHIREHLELSENRPYFEHFISEEAYIVPAIKDFVFTGSIVRKKDDQKFYLVLNPSCDFAQQKAHFVLVSKIDPDFSLLKDTLRKYKNTLELKEDDPTRIKCSTNLKNLLKNNCSPQYYYLPKSHSFDGGLIDFQRLTSYKKKQFDIDFEIYGTVTSSFMKDITAKFSFYYSRQGSPDFELEKMINKLS